MPKVIFASKLFSTELFFFFPGGPLQFGSHLKQDIVESSILEEEDIILTCGVCCFPHCFIGNVHKQEDEPEKRCGWSPEELMGVRSDYDVVHTKGVVTKRR